MFLYRQLPKAPVLDKRGSSTPYLSSNIEDLQLLEAQILDKRETSDSLSFIRVEDCPLLEKRCQFEKDEEWPYIYHIPKIVIKGVLF